MGHDELQTPELQCPMETVHWPGKTVKPSWSPWWCFSIWGSTSFQKKSCPNTSEGRWVPQDLATCTASSPRLWLWELLPARSVTWDGAKSPLSIGNTSKDPFSIAKLDWCRKVQSFKPVRKASRRKQIKNLIRIAPYREEIRLMPSLWNAQVELTR